MAMAVVNARVDKQTLDQARRVFAIEGTTVSEAIRDLIERTARTGRVPERLNPAVEYDQEALRRVDELTAYLESLPMPGRDPNKTAEEVLGEERMRRFGYEV